MRLSRWVFLVLALSVSPVPAAVCEVACGTPGHAAHESAPAPVPDAVHAHHGHQAGQAQAATAGAPVSVSGAEARVHLPGPDCDPVLALAGRVRSSFSGPDLHTSGVALVASGVDSDLLTPAHAALRDTGPPDPPRHAPVPLRI